MAGPEPKELPLGAPPPAMTPPEGVVISRVEADGWTRKYLYKIEPSMGDAVVENSSLIAEIPPNSPRATERQLAGPEIHLPMLPAEPRLGQAPPSPAPASPACAPPPGPLQMPDGTLIQLDDKITLGELWGILPFMAQRCVEEVEKENLPPPPPPQGVPGAMPTQAIGAGFPGFGPASGMFGQGGFIAPGISGGAGLSGPLGPVNTIPQTPITPSVVGPQGPPGPQGPAGTPGVGATIDFVTKTDGDFTAGPGSFIPIPGTLLAFSQGATGNVMFVINACFGCGDATNNALALSIDGTIVPIQANLWQTFVGGVEGFLDGATAMWPMMLSEGSHQVQLMLRGIMAGEFCAGAGLGLSATISANPNIPLSLAVVHQALGSLPPGAPALVLDGLSKTDAPFGATGALTAVPSTLLVFTVTTPGNVLIIVSADFSATPFNSLPEVSLGFILDGGTPQFLTALSLNIGHLQDKLFTCHLFGSIVIPNVPAGTHGVQMAYFSGPGAPSIMALQASAALPATIAAIHT